jgi:predicted dienelactone hydrolase
MRTLEWLMAALAIPAIVWMIVKPRPWPTWIRMAAGLAVGVFIAHVWWEGLHWQMAPIYLAILLLVYPLLFQTIPPRKPKLTMIFGLFLAMLIVAGLALCYALPMFHLSKPTGPYAVGTSTLYFVDPQRKEAHPGAPPIQREVVAQLWYPSATYSGKHAMYRLWKETDPRSTYQAVLPVDSLQDAPLVDGRFPVVLFNHAWRGFRNRSTFIAQDLASHGFVVIGVGHPWNAAILQLHDGRVADGRSEVDLGDFYGPPTLTLEQHQALANSEMRVQVDDDRFLLDELAKLDQSPSSPLAGHLDLAHVGAFGHSFGGAVSAELAREDNRVLSAILLDGILAGPVATAGLPKPLFRIMAVPPPLKPGSENAPDLGTRVHAQMSLLGEKELSNSFQRFGGYQVVINGIDHENFTDKGFFSPFHSLSGIGSLPQKRAATIINAYIVAFFTQTLRNQAQPLLSGQPSPFPEVRRFQLWQAPVGTTP